MILSTKIETEHGKLPYERKARTRNQMHRQEGNDIVLLTQLGERAYITTGCCKNAKVCFENFPKIAL